MIPNSFARLGQHTLALSLVSLFLPYVSAQDSGPVITPYDWSQVEATTDLQWKDCYQDSIQCARLKVPQNYSDPSQGDATIPVIRVRSPVADTDDYKGPILFNPGGPGGSGIAELSLAGPGYRAMFGPHFDLISFDPRGVNLSTPAVNLSSEASLLSEHPDLLELGEGSWDTLPERIKLLEEFGERVKNKSGDELRHITTDNVARDMVTIVEALGLEKIMYYGISYGTVLGSTFASMFPDKIERMAIDGVVDQEAYYTNDWSKNIIDADEALQIFFEACSTAGPDACAFHESSASAINDRFDRLIANLTASPPQLPDNTTLTLTVFQAVVQSKLYWPTQYPALATALQGLESGEDLSSFVFAQAQEMGPVANAIRCSDAEPVTDGVEELEEFDKRVREATKYFPGAVEGTRLFCRGWKIHPDNFDGPIGAKNTSHPLLVIGNTADPVTPLAAAKDTAENKFPGSRLLTYDIPGHTSVAWNSDCVKQHLRTYFLNGTLPEEGTICPRPGEVFSPNTTVAIDPSTN